MGFAYPFLFLLLWAIPFLAGLYFFSEKIKSRRLNLFGEPELMKLLSGATSRKKQRIKAVLVVIAILALIIAAAGPQIGTKMTDIKRKGVDVFIAIDCSKSMLAEDIVPNRLSKAKLELSSFINKLQGDRIGIIAFAGMAFLQCPLTLDYNAAKMFLDLIDTNLIPRPGTNIPSAIRLAIESFVRKEKKYKALIILTDGESHEGNIDDAIEEAKREGVRIYTVGFGSPAGEPIATRDENGNITGYLKDKNGEVVMSRLDEATLQKIALETGGQYYRATDGEIEVDRIYEEISGMEKKELQAKIYSQRENRYQYFLLIAFVLLLFEMLLSERKGVFVGLFLLLIFLLPDSGYASLRAKINKGTRLYNQGKFEEALREYQDAQIDQPESHIVHFNIGDAVYKTQDYIRALEEFTKASYAKDRSIQQKSSYNAGNCLYKVDRLEEALQQYRKALDLNPDDRDAKYNMELIYKKMRESKKPVQEQEKNKKEAEQKKKGEGKGKKKEEEKKEKQSQKGRGGEEKDKQEQKQQQEQKKSEISKEDARRILDALQETEKKASRERKKVVPVYQGVVVKDW